MGILSVVSRHARVAGILLLSIACGQEHNDELPEEFRGRWYYLGSSGGLAGDGLGDPATGYIEIRADNTVDWFEDDGTLVASSTFTVSRGSTISSADPMWMLSHTNGMTEVIIPSKSGDSLALAENVYDGIGRGYARMR